MIRARHSRGARVARRVLSILVGLVVLTEAGCTAANLGNAPLAHWEAEGTSRAGATPRVALGRAAARPGVLRRRHQGGAAFAYGVLEELAATPVVLGGRSGPLLDEVDLISAVSGGSFTAAYYGLYGDRIFRDFEAGFLKRPVERDLVLQLFRPRNWVRLASLYFNRSQLAADY